MPVHNGMGMPLLPKIESTEPITIIVGQAQDSVN